MNLIDNGLRGYEHTHYGGWGGRGAPDRDATGASPRDHATARWFEFAQRDFAARLSSPWSLWHSQPSADAAPDDYAQLTNFADSVTSPAISPDGRTLTFIRGISSFQGPGQIYVKSLPDGSQRN
ncbi:MAG TPA: hypothetical protein VFS23_22215 [Vicinamibacterales bacterium]|nr:hypothetical protein [Vicinamibacterales bacterium]